MPGVGVEGKRSRGSVGLGEEGGSHQKGRRSRAESAPRERDESPADPSIPAERVSGGEAPAGWWRRKAGDGRGRLAGPTVLSSARIPRWVREKRGQRASPSPAARGAGEGGTARSSRSLSPDGDASHPAFSCCGGLGAGPGPLPSPVGSPSPSCRVGSAGCEGRARPGAGSWRGEAAELCPSPLTQAPWSNPAWQASRASGARLWVLPPPPAAFLPPGCCVFLEESLWSLHPVPNLQSKLALGPLLSLHPVTSSPACHLPRCPRPIPACPPARKGGQSPAGGCWLSPWESRLGAGSLPWCQLEQDPVRSADFPLGN